MMTLEQFAELQIDHNDGTEAQIAKLYEIVRTQRDLMNIMDEELTKIRQWINEPEPWEQEPQDLRQAYGMGGFDIEDKW